MNNFNEQEFELNELYADVLSKYYELCDLTLETENKVPQKYCRKIDKILFKLMWKQFKRAKRVYKHNLNIIKRAVFIEKLKLFFSKFKISLKKKKQI